MKILLLITLQGNNLYITLLK